MDADQLPDFRKLVAATRSLAPSQSAALREIVTQVFLAGQTYAISERLGFLGVRPTEVDLKTYPPPVIVAGADAPNTDADAVRGVIISERMPGFCGWRAFQDGDIVLSIVEKPELRLGAPFDFGDAIRSLGAGSVTRLKVLRQGRIVNVSVVLDARPHVAENPPAMQQLLADRNQAARRYWETQFAPLLDEELGDSRSGSRRVDPGS